jgi:hypothetical protein
VAIVGPEGGDPFTPAEEEEAPTGPTEGGEDVATDRAIKPFDTVVDNALVVGAGGGGAE